MDYEDDRMCFLVIAGDPLWQAPSGMTVRSYLPPLKIHDSAYALVEHSPLVDQALEESDIFAYFRYEQFTYPNETLPKNVIVERHFKMQFERLAFYGSDQYDRFFWSAHKTGKYFDGVDWNEVESPPNLVLDILRHKHWSTLRDKFETLGSKGSSMEFGFYEDPDPDPCHYEDLFDNVEFAEVRTPSDLGDDLPCCAHMLNINPSSRRCVFLLNRLPLSCPRGASRKFKIARCAKAVWRTCCFCLPTTPQFTLCPSIRDPSC